jgi:hypothetical protein
VLGNFPTSLKKYFQKSLDIFWDVVYYINCKDKTQAQRTNQMLVFKKQIPQAVESRLTEAQRIADEQNIQVVIVVNQYSARKYCVGIQLANHRPGIKVEDVYNYDGQEMTVHAIVNPKTKEEVKTELPTPETKTTTAECYRVGKLTKQDCVDAIRANKRTHLIRVTERGYEILDRRSLAEKLTNPLKNTLANFGDNHYLVTEARYQELISN